MGHAAILRCIPKPFGMPTSNIIRDILWIQLFKLEDLNVLKRSPDLLNNVKIRLAQLRLFMKHILFYHIWGLWPFWSSDLKQSNEFSIKQPSDF